MIGTNILYFSFLCAGWVSAVSAAPTVDEMPIIEYFLYRTDLHRGEWADAFHEIDVQHPTLLERYLTVKFREFGKFVHDNHDNFSSEETWPTLNATFNSIPRLVYLMRYSNLRILQYLKQSWQNELSGTAVEVIDDRYVNNVAARYHREKRMETPSGGGKMFMPYMLDVAVLFSMNDSMLGVDDLPEDWRMRLDHYQHMIIQVHNDMAGFMKLALAECYQRETNRLQAEIEKLNNSGIRGFLTHEIQMVAAKLVESVLEFMIMYGNHLHPTPALVSSLIAKYQELRRYLNVDNGQIKATHTYWDDLLQCLRPDIIRIRKELRGENRWFKIFSSMLYLLSQMRK
jgi:hypothetical protein